MSTYEAALPATLTEQETLECYDFSCSDSVGFSGITTSATNYIRIYTPAGQGHNGTSRAVSGSGFRLTGTDGTGVFRNGVNHIRLEGLEIEATSTGKAMALSSVSAGSDVRVDKCIIHDGLTGTGYTVTATGTNLALTWRNNIVYGSQRSWDTRGATSVTSENNIFWRHAAQLGLVSTAELTCKNTYSGHTGAAAEDFWTGGAAPSGNNNASSDTSQATDYTSGVSSVAGSSVFTSVTAGSENFTLVAGTNALVDAGETLGSVTDDIIGTARPQGSVYDIGAFERIAAGGFKPYWALNRSQILGQTL